MATLSLTSDSHAETAGDTARNRGRDLSRLTHRQLIGWLGLFLPFVLFMLAGVWYTAGLARWETLESISAYYYTGATSAFIGMLFALALFLFTYGGYEDDLTDRVMGKLGGISALGVVFFPTGAPATLSEPSWWIPVMRTMHYVSAVSLFVIFALFSLWLFRKTSVPKGESLPPDKRRRNRLYLVCGIVIVVSILWAGSSRFTGSAIFWPETIALCAFAVSWLVKGHAYRPVRSIAQRLLAWPPSSMETNSFRDARGPVSRRGKGPRLRTGSTIFDVRPTRDHSSTAVAQHRSALVPPPALAVPRPS